MSDTILAITPLGFPWRTRDPFLFCVHHDDAYPAGNAQLGPAASLAGRDIGQDFAGKDGWRMYHGDTVPGFPQHPHRGFETVTVVRKGLLDHSDSLGAAARFGGGDVQWLTAGKGILHAEMFPLLDAQNSNPLELFQIWLNLPSSNKMVPPYFSMLWNHTIPRHVTHDKDGRATEVAIVSGHYFDKNGAAKKGPPPPPDSWAAQADTGVAIWTIKMAAHAAWTLPAAGPGLNRSLYFFRGTEMHVLGHAIPTGHAIDVLSDKAIELTAGSDEVEILLLQGAPIGQPVVQYGPFVMNTQEEIRQAFSDYQRTQFGGWPWPSDAPVHGHDSRFARHADGTIEKPTTS